MTSEVAGLHKKAQERIQDEIKKEYRQKISFLQKRDDFVDGFGYFLETILLSTDPLKFRKRFSRPVAGSYCITTPLEILDALGFHPVRLSGGSLAAHAIPSVSLPVSACPVIKSHAGFFYLNDSLDKLCDIIILPNTCNLKTKMAQAIADKSAKLYVMEVPHNPEKERNNKRWLEEVCDLRRHLEKKVNKTLRRKDILDSIDKYNKAWAAFTHLMEMRRKGFLSGTWALALANAFMFDDVYSWVAAVDSIIKNGALLKKKYDLPRVFLVGAPLFFPYLKISELIEEAGMFVAADDLCTSERLFSSTVYKDPSEYGLLRAIAEKYYLPCRCPKFSNTEQKARNILEIMRKYDIKGVIFHLLNGCHLYDMESNWLEKLIKENGFHFLRIETDYSPQDRENIAIRLEAFREILI